MLDYQPGPTFAEWHLWFNRYDFDLKLLSFGTFSQILVFSQNNRQEMKWNDDDRSDDVSKTTDLSKSDSMKWRNDCNCNCDWLLQEPIKFEESVENFWLKKKCCSNFFSAVAGSGKNVAGDSGTWISGSFSGRRFSACPGKNSPQNNHV